MKVGVVEGMKNGGTTENAHIHRLLMREDIIDVIHTRGTTAVEREVIIGTIGRIIDANLLLHLHLRKEEERSIKSIIIIRDVIHRPLQTEVPAWTADD